MYKRQESQLLGSPKEYLLNEIKEIIEKTTFTYVRQQKMLGLGHAILAGKPLIGNEAFAVILADDLCVSEKEGVLSQMIEVYKKYKCSIIAIEEVGANQAHKYGIINGEMIDDQLYKVTDMVEKPNKPSSNLAIIGRYILTPDIFDIIKQVKPDKNGEIQITDALLQQAKEGRVIAYKFNGSRYDCGEIKGYLQAINHFAKKIKLN